MEYNPIPMLKIQWQAEEIARLRAELLVRDRLIEELTRKYLALSDFSREQNITIQNLISSHAL